MGYLRKATLQDLDLLFAWVNDRSVRKNAFSTSDIVYEEHKKWYEQLFMRNDVMQYIYMCDNQPIGQVRINIENETAEIDYSICPQKRSLGHGKEMIHLLKEQVKQDFPNVKKLIAKVKPDNTASQKVFQDTGYTEKYYFYESELTD